MAGGLSGVLDNHGYQGVRCPDMGKVALTEQQQEVRRLYKARVSVRQIALALDISTQRVYQHLERLRALGVIR